MTNDQRLNAIQKAWKVYLDKMIIVNENFEKEKLLKQKAKLDQINKNDTDAGPNSDSNLNDEIEPENKNQPDDDQLDKLDMKQI